MGFHNFKLVPDQTKGSRGALNAISRSRPANTKQAVVKSTKTIYLYSFPKCGRTWLRFLLANYFNLLFKLNVPVDLHTLFTLLPNDLSGLKGIDSFQFYHIPDFPLILSSHRPCKKDGILLLRSIPDVVVSDYFQQKKLGLFDGSMSEFINSKQGSLYRYCDYLNKCSQTDAPEPLLTLSYEGLHQDTAGELKKLLCLLDIPVRNEFLKSAAECSQFDQMQEIEKEFRLAGFSNAKENPEASRVRKGKVGGYINYLSKNEIEKLFTIANGLLTAQAQDLLKANGIDVHMSDMESGLIT